MHLTRALLGALLCLASLMTFVRGALAQPAGRAAADSAAAAAAEVRPTYTSSYSVVRRAALWQQVFSFRNKWNGITVDNSTNYKIQTDASRVNYQNRGGDSNTTLSFMLLGTMPFEVNLNYSRYGIDDNKSTRADNTLDTGLKATYYARFFRGMSGTVAGRLGLVNLNSRNNFSGDVSDTRELGLSQDVNASATYNGPMPGMSFKMNSTFNGVHKSTKTTSESGTDAPPEGPGPNTRSTLGLSWNYSPWNYWTFDAAYDRLNSNQQFILASVDRTKNNQHEVALDKSSGYSTTLGFKPKGGLTEIWTQFQVKSSSSERRVQLQQASNSGTHSFEAKLRHTLFGNSFFLHAQNTNDRNSAVLGPATRLTRVVDGYVDRTWTPALTTRVLGQLSLTSQKYESEKSRKQDFDSLKKRLELTANYRFWSKFTTNLSSRWSADQRNVIDPSQSKGTQLDETYAANGTLTYAMTLRTLITQKYDFTELFTSRRFDPSASNMQRTRSVNTSVTTSLSRKVALSFAHTYFFQELGGYRRDEKGVRYFSRGSLKYRQELGTTVSYTLADWITFGTDERLTRTDQIGLLPYNRTVESQLTFTQRGSFKRPIPGGGNFTCDLALDIQKYTRPARDPKRYFTARVSVDKTF